MLIAHVRPLRKNLVSSHIEVHEALASGNRIAARFMLYARMRKRSIATVALLRGDRPRRANARGPSAHPYAARPVDRRA